jgi:DNA-directed RNA polymerase subunit RPC12/RpoP
MSCRTRVQKPGGDNVTSLHSGKKRENLCPYCNSRILGKVRSHVEGSHPEKLDDYLKNVDKREGGVSSFGDTLMEIKKGDLPEM